MIFCKADRTFQDEWLDLIELVKVENPYEIAQEYMNSDLKLRENLLKILEDENFKKNIEEAFASSIGKN